MAQPANTIASFDQRGIREDLQDVIYDISPEETPFYSRSAKAKARNVFHEWQTDELRVPGVNAHIEGDDTVAELRSPTERVGNRTQIFKNAVVVSGTDTALDKAGRAAEMAYQIMKVAKEQKRDIETALFANQAQVVGSSVVPPRLAGTGSWVITNVNNIGGAGANPATPNGTAPRTDGSQTALDQAKFNANMQAVWTAGGDPDTVYLGPAQMNVALTFTGNNNQRSQIDASRATVANVIDVYRTPWGTVNFQLSRWSRSRDVWIMQSDMWAIGVLRGTKNEPLAKTGDNEKRQVVTELTLICKNEKASGLIADVS
jgi:hypothetical protein